MTPAPLLIGARVRLTAVTPQDVPAFARWHQDVEFMRLLDAAPARPLTEAQLSEWLAEHQKAHDFFQFAIRLLASGELVGALDLNGILWNQGTASIAIAIGDPAQRGKGYGREALSLALDYAFAELNLHRVGLTVFSYNVPAIRLYESLGFRHEGTSREFLCRDGQRYDMLHYGLLRSEWEGR